MALKRKISKETFDGLSKDLQVEYLNRGDSYFLDVDDDDTGALRRAKDRAVQERKEAEKRAREAEDKLTELNGDDARKAGDIEKLEASWRDKHEKQRMDFAEKLAGKDKFISSMLIDSVASAMANKISTSPTLILPHIKARLKADLDRDTPVTRVLDTSGNVSSATVKDLEKELIDNKEFASIIIANKSTGGGASDKGRQFSGAMRSPGDKPPLLSDMSSKDLAALLKAKKEEAGDNNES